MTTVVWLLVAFAGGYLFAHLLPFRVHVERYNMPRRFVPSRDNLAPLIVMMAFGLMTVTGITAFVRSEQVNDDLRDSVVCFSKYNQKYAEAARARTDATAARDDSRAEYDIAVQEFLGAAASLISEGSASEEQYVRAQVAGEKFNQAAADLRASTAQLNKAREDQPYPEFPTEFCAPQDKE